MNKNSGSILDINGTRKAGKAEMMKRLNVAEQLCVGDLPPTLFEDGDPRNKLYSHFVDYMMKSGNVASADIFTLKQLCTVIDRLNVIDDTIDNLKMQGLKDKELATVRKNYFSDYMKLIDVLGLSPQARVKMACNAKVLEEKDPLDGILG